jgi:outer membrane lipopolysaccharide assembly protein LptE/RlpB
MTRPFLSPRGRLTALFTTSALLVLSGCLYKLGGGGGLPSDIKTMAIMPFENPTATPELQRELHEKMRTQIRDRLGVREASADKASAIVRGSIERYEADIPVSYTATGKGSNSVRRMLQLVVDVEIINQKTGRTLFKRKGLMAEGQYEERAEARGREIAIEQLVMEIIRGAQSQW